jgi:hypothetical protein
MVKIAKKYMKFQSVEGIGYAKFRGGAFLWDSQGVLARS